MRQVYPVSSALDQLTNLQHLGFKGRAMWREGEMITDVDLHLPNIQTLNLMMLGTHTSPWTAHSLKICACASFFCEDLQGCQTQ